MKKILVSFGTRPEAIKLAPIIAEAKKRKIEVKVVVSGQHKEMLTPFLDFFEIVPDANLSILKPNQSLADITAAILAGMNPILQKEKPDLVFVQGDTATTFATALAAFYLKIPVVHIEAGLRTQDRYSPFPEEMNRLMVARLADYHFAATEAARVNLQHEGIQENVFVTGNSGVDALRITLKRCPAPFGVGAVSLSGNENIYHRSVLITCHRRENHGQPLEEICDAIVRLAEQFPDVRFDFPVHLNPNVQTVVNAKLTKIPNVKLMAPLDYFQFVQKMVECSVILTDSGGVQEEAPYLKKPIFVLRESTERQEGVDAGVAELVGSDQDKIVERVTRALTDASYYQKFQQAVSPYGDGFAAEKIFNHLF